MSENRRGFLKLFGAGVVAAPVVAEAALEGEIIPPAPATPEPQLYTLNIVTSCYVGPNATDLEKTVAKMIRERKGLV